MERRGLIDSTSKYGNCSFVKLEMHIVGHVLPKTYKSVRSLEEQTATGSGLYTEPLQGHLPTCF